LNFAQAVFISFQKEVIYSFCWQDQLAFFIFVSNERFLKTLKNMGP